MALFSVLLFFPFKFLLTLIVKKKTNKQKKQVCGWREEDVAS